MARTYNVVLGFDAKLYKSWVQLVKDTAHINNEKHLNEDNEESFIIEEFS